MRLLKKLEQHLRRIWKSWQGTAELPRFIARRSAFANVFQPMQ